MKVDRSILPSGRIGLAVSGGADSVALAFLMTKGGKKRNAAKRRWRRVASASTSLPGA